MNEAVLVLMLFTVNPSDQPENLQVVTESFSTLEECNYVGRNVRQIYQERTGKVIPPVVKTVSYCVHFTEFSK